MLEDIMLIFDKNFGRLNNLINLYQSLSQGKGRKPAHSLDILRATVVLMHSTLEDYLRSLLRWKLPDAGKERINKIPLVGSAGRQTKFELGELITYREKTVQQVVESSIQEYLNTQSYNNTTQVCWALADIGINDLEKIKTYLHSLESMITRRHNIVHQADRAENSGRGHHNFKSISLKQIEKWKRHLDKFVVEVNRQLLP